MLIRTIVACLALGACVSGCSPGVGEVRAGAAEPLAVGESFTVDSRVMGEARRVNVLVPTVYGQKIEGPMPVLYMLDGGVDEDFLHVAGLVRVVVSNGGLGPLLRVGIPNEQRWRDMPGPAP